MRDGDRQPLGWRLAVAPGLHPKPPDAHAAFAEKTWPFGLNRSYQRYVTWPTSSLGAESIDYMARWFAEFELDDRYQQIESGALASGLIDTEHTRAASNTSR